MSFFYIAHYQEILHAHPLPKCIDPVCAGNRPKPSAAICKNIQQLTNELELVSENAAFNKMVRNDLQRLHEGNVARYRLKLSEFQGHTTDYQIKKTGVPI